MKLEFGGGTSPKRGFFNVDLLPSADLLLDLNTLGDSKLPFADQSVEEFYSSHCFEHLTNWRGPLNEIVRVLKDGAPCEIRVPHWASAMANTLGHPHSLSDHQVQHLVEFQDVWWDTGRFLKPVKVEYVASVKFHAAARLVPAWTPLDIVWFLQDTCHEIRFHFVAGPREAVSFDKIPKKVV